jgi:hypothetical protein
MPFCPKCGSEYREGFTFCADCDRELVAERPATTEDEENARQEAAEARKDSEPLEVVYTVREELEANTIKSVLQQAGIPFAEMRDRDAVMYAVGPLPIGDFPYCRIMTYASYADRARQVIRDYLAAVQRGELTLSEDQDR